MRVGLALVELLVVMGIIAVTTASTIVVVNRSRSREKLLAVKNELVANIRLARNFARTLQVPSGYSQDLDHVSVDLTADGLMTVAPYPSDGSYFSKDVSPDGVSIAMTPNQISFEAYSGKLLKSSGGNFVLFGAGETQALIISSLEDVSEIQTIVINSSGLVDEKR